MSDEERYRKALIVVFNGLQGDGLDLMKPVSARFANDILNFVAGILDGLSIETAIEELKAKA